MEKDKTYMRRCLLLAAKGEAGAAPNPMVGAVIVANDRIIGEGYHVRHGSAHAEVNAFASVKEADRQLLPQSTLYVSLEPCSHYGKTPPCAELIVRRGVKRVVVGCEDPFERVSGRGIARLREAGIEVEVGVLRDECRYLNRRFITFHERRRPFITLKWAESSDGYIDRWREFGDEEEVPVRLSTEASTIHVHHQRSLCRAILVGHSTLRLDHSRLTIRSWRARDLERLVLGRVSEGELPSGWQAYADTESLLSSLHAQGVQSLMVEGGAHTLKSFIDAGLWDEAQVELSQQVLGSGIPAPRLPRGLERRILHRFGSTFLTMENLQI